MLNEFLIFTAIILIPINALLHDHVSFRIAERKRLKKKSGLRIFQQEMIDEICKSFRKAGIAAPKSGLYLQQFGRACRDAKPMMVNIDIQRGTVLSSVGNPSVPTSILLETPLIIKERPDIFCVTEESVS